MIKNYKHNNVKIKQIPLTSTIKYGKGLFKIHSKGIKINIESLAYDFKGDLLFTKIKSFIKQYNALKSKYYSLSAMEFEKFKEKPSLLKAWTHSKIEKECISDKLLLNYLLEDRPIYLGTNKIVECEYRPLLNKYIYYDDFLIDHFYKMIDIFGPLGDRENYVLLIGKRTTHIVNKPWIFTEEYTGFPLYNYGKNLKKSNMEASIVKEYNAFFIKNTKNFNALEQLRLEHRNHINNAIEVIEEKKLKILKKNFYKELNTINQKDISLTEEEIFYYIYAVLHQEEQKSYKKIEELTIGLKHDLYDFYLLYTLGKELAFLNLYREYIPTISLKFINKGEYLYVENSIDLNMENSIDLKESFNWNDFKNSYCYTILMDLGISIIEEEASYSIQLKESIQKEDAKLFIKKYYTIFNESSNIIRKIQEIRRI